MYREANMYVLFHVFAGVYSSSSNIVPWKLPMLFSETVSPKETWSLSTGLGMLSWNSGLHASLVLDYKKLSP